jgi:hypothetical protein
MDDRNVEWLDNNSPINHPFKGSGPTNLLLPQLIFRIPFPDLNSLKKQVS